MKYYIYPVIEEYRKCAPESEKGIALRRKIAANIGDMATLRMVLGIDPPEFASFYPDMKTNTPSTFDTIDSFLNKFGSTTGMPVPGAYVIGEEEGDDSSVRVKSGEYKEWPELVKNKKYKEAIEIIKGQNLNNTNKNVYFADQMRFLQKLMAIESYKKRK